MCTHLLGSLEERTTEVEHHPVRLQHLYHTHSSSVHRPTINLKYSYIKIKNSIKKYNKIINQIKSYLATLPPAGVVLAALHRHINRFAAAAWEEME
jgi:hypothetical protein